MNKVTEQDALAWKKMYEEDGLTIEEISLEVGMSTKTVKNWLHKVNTEMRKPGGPPTHKNKATDGIRGKPEDKIPKGAKRASYTGHRRRSQF